MTDEVNSLRFEMNVLWFVVLFIGFAAYCWLRIISKRLKKLTEQLEELKGKTVVNEANLNLQKRRKK